MSWKKFLPYKLPRTVPVDEAIRLAKLDFDLDMENCIASGGCDGDYSGQMRGVDEKEAEWKRLKKLKRQSVKNICTHCGGIPA